jgi:uncharacterized protein (TIGR03435 family)
MTGAIRLNTRTGPGTADPSRVNYQYASLKNLLMNAYGVKNFQVVGPDWLDTERFDVVATLAPGTTKEQVAIMLQNLLADRFKVTLHHETKELPVYDLVIGKNGSKLKPYVNDPAAPQPGPLTPGPLQMDKNGFPVIPPGALVMMMSPKGRRVSASKQPMSNLVNMLSGELGRTVIDKTGLTGEFDYTLEFLPESGAGLLGGLPPPPPAPPGGPAPGPGAIDNAEAPSLFSAVQDQLGLKLEQKRGPVDLLVIDHAEKVPTAN